MGAIGPIADTSGTPESEGPRRDIGATLSLLTRLLHNQPVDPGTITSDGRLGGRG